MRVPAILRWPGRLKPRVASQVLTVMDLFPTLAAAAEVRPRNQRPLDGRNLWLPIREGRAEPREDLFFVTESQSTVWYAIFHKEWKLVREISRQGGAARDHLFRIAADPKEEKNHAPRFPEVVRDLSGRIDRWRAVHPVNGVRFSAQAPAGWQAPAQWAEAAAA
jgi:arylsulfatase A-like enzyme